MLTYQTGTIPGYGMPIKAFTSQELGPTGKEFFRKTLAAVCAAHGVSPADVMGEARLAYLVRARHEVAWRMRNVRKPTGKPRFSFPQIGEFMNRDHTTIIHAVRE
ncbi:helix-turn-helix domain-containing protein, partial [Phenylobacterium sp.]|uniref:helix-turn-helix domain-containing protein n=1 Tax=Phenylobacterium sp. TaxID=1871053 RepID=UPI0025E29CF9